jgi:hypothetical protein
VSDRKLPCDVMLPPRTILRKGVSVDTLMIALERRDGWPDTSTRFPSKSGAPMKRDTIALVVVFVLVAGYLLAMASAAVVGLLS